MNKVILIDSSGIFVPTVKVVNRIKQEKYNQKNTHGFVLPARVMYFNSLLSCLKKINLDKDDIVIIAGEGHSWRKNIYSPYKAQRQELRDNDKFVDWKHEFEQFNDLHRQLELSTNWYFIRVNDGLEADDVIAIASRYFKNNETIIITGDKDLHQLSYYENVKIFNINKKVFGSKGVYEKVINPLGIIESKIRLGDKGDNIIVYSTDDENDYLLRNTLVNLLELPEYIEKKGIEAIQEALSIKKELNLDLLPKFKNCKEKFLEIYNPKHKITYEYCMNLLEKRDKKKKEKLKEKRELDKLKNKGDQNGSSV
jgi:5'-3' exonuclease